MGARSTLLAAFPDGSVVAPSDAALAQLEKEVDQGSKPRRKGSLGVVPNSQTEVSTSKLKLKLHKLSMLHAASDMNE